MTGVTDYERAASRVLRWCAWYTKDLGDRVAGERRDEIASDLHEEALDARARGLSPREGSRMIVARALRGVLADLSWRAARLRRGDGVSLGELRLRRGGQAVTGVLFVLGVLLTGTGVVTLALLIRGTVLGGTMTGPAVMVGIAVLTLLSALGAGLLVPRATRVVGALTLAIPAAGLLSAAAGSLWFVSATTQLLVARIDSLNLIIIACSAGITLLCLASAAWWWPNRSTQRVHNELHERNVTAHG